MKRGFGTRTLEAGGVHSMIFWGPPGTGKTTLSRLIAGRAGAKFIQINATSLRQGGRGAFRFPLL